MVVLSLRGSLQGEVVVSSSGMVSPKGLPGEGPGPQCSPTWRERASSGSGGDGGSGNGEMTMRLEVSGGPVDWRSAVAMEPQPNPVSSPTQRHLAPAVAAQYLQRIPSNVAGSAASGSESLRYLARNLSAVADASGQSSQATSSTGMVSAYDGCIRDDSHVVRAAQGTGSQLELRRGNWDAPMATDTRPGNAMGMLPPSQPQPHQHPLMQLLGQASEDLQLLSNRLKPLVEPRPGTSGSR